jgi:hypothetical protein
VKERGGLEKNMRRERQSCNAHATAAAKQGLAITTTAATPSDSIWLLSCSSASILVSSKPSELVFQGDNSVTRM